jgi:hypothetical protein
LEANDSRAKQASFREKYRQDPASALTLKAEGRLGAGDEVQHRHEKSACRGGWGALLADSSVADGGGIGVAELTLTLVARERPIVAQKSRKNSK